jgi:hypothetical protein
VIGAYFHMHQGDFASFEAKIRDVLAQGLVVQMRRKLFSALGIRVVAAFVIIGNARASREEYPQSQQSSLTCGAGWPCGGSVGPSES